MGERWLIDDTSGGCRRRNLATSRLSLLILLRVQFSCTHCAANDNALKQMLLMFRGMPWLPSDMSVKRQE